MPIQRIPRYKLLLEDLIKFSDITHVDYAGLHKALACVKELANNINERKRDAEAAARVEKIKDLFDKKTAAQIVQPSRRFVREGPVKKADWRSNRWLILFNDILLLADKRND